MRKNTDYRIISIEEQNRAAERGEDSAYFHVKFSPKRKLSATYDIYVEFTDIIEYWREINPPLYQYVQSIRSNMTGYGHKHSKVLSELAESHIQVKAWVKDYVMANCELYVEEDQQEMQRKRRAEREQQIATEQDAAAKQKEAEVRASLRELSQLAVNEKEYIKLFDDLAESIDEAIIAIVLKKHPYLLEAKGNRVRELQYILADYTPDLTKEIIEFLLEIKQELKEQYPPTT